MDDKPTLVEVDVDAIPVVRLEGMPSLPASNLPPLRATSQTFVPKEFVIDREGEMPVGAVTQEPSTPVPGTRASTSKLVAPTPSRTSSYPAYETPDEIIRTSTPDPIKVTRPKKKVTKKKRTPTVVVDP